MEKILNPLYRKTLVAKTKALISFAVTLICVFVFAYMQNVGFLMTRLNYVYIYRLNDKMFEMHLYEMLQYSSV